MFDEIVGTTIRDETIVVRSTLDIGVMEVRIVNFTICRAEHVMLATSDIAPNDRDVFISDSPICH